jgi:hypothetical protein
MKQTKMNRLYIQIPSPPSRHEITIPSNPKPFPRSQTPTSRIPKLNSPLSHPIRTILSPPLLSFLLPPQSSILNPQSSIPPPQPKPQIHLPNIPKKKHPHIIHCPVAPQNPTPALQPNHLPFIHHSAEAACLKHSSGTRVHTEGLACLGPNADATYVTSAATALQFCVKNYGMKGSEIDLSVCGDGAVR